MQKSTIIASLSAAALAGVLSVASVAPASAFPAGKLGAAAGTVSQADNVSWVCGPYRCWWQPNYYVAPGFYAGSRIYGGGYYGRRFYGGRYYGGGPRWGGGTHWGGGRWAGGGRRYR